MRLQRWFGSAVAAVMLSGAVAAPIAAGAMADEYARRQKMKNEWRNIGLGSGAVALWGLLKGDKTLTFVGAAGALYSLHRYEQDRKSQSKVRRARAAMFSKRSFTRNGKTYTRRTVVRNGKTYYQFVRK